MRGRKPSDLTILKGVRPGGNRRKHVHTLEPMLSAPEHLSVEEKEVFELVRQNAPHGLLAQIDRFMLEAFAQHTVLHRRALDGREITRFSGAHQTLHTAGSTIEVYEKTLRQRIIAAIADPNIALILLVLGALGIYAEFSSPGLIAPGVIGVILLLLGLSALSVLPINWLGAALLLTAVALFVLEAKFTSHGILGLGGAVAMVLGAVLLVNGPIPEMRVHWGTAIGLALPFSIITVMLVSLAIRARRNKVQTGAEAMIGSMGSAVTELSPEGKILVRGEYWNAVAVEPVPAGAHVRVTAIHNLKLTVEPIPDRTGG